MPRARDIDLGMNMWLKLGQWVMKDFLWAFQKEFPWFSGKAAQNHPSSSSWAMQHEKQLNNFDTRSEASLRTKLELPQKDGEQTDGKKETTCFQKSLSHCIQATCRASYFLIFILGAHPSPLPLGSIWEELSVPDSQMQQHTRGHLREVCFAGSQLSA